MMRFLKIARYGNGKLRKIRYRLHDYGITEGLLLLWASAELVEDNANITQFTSELV
jgi:hypothetical protein